MPGFDTAATIISDVARELGLVPADIANPWASTDANVLQLVALLKPTGRELAKAHQWSHLQREAYVDTDVGAPSYPLADDFGRFIDGTAWNRDTNEFIPGSVTPQQWQQAQSSGGATSVSHVLRVQGSSLSIYPIITTSQLVYYEYISRNWGAALFAKETPTAAADVIQFDAHLFGRLLKLRFKVAKGFDTTAETADYRDALASAIGQDGAAPTLSISGPRRMPYPNVPETGFGS